MQIKVALKWDNQQKNMVSQKGIWYLRTKQNGEVFYKLRRYCDEYGRRFFISPDLSKEDGFYTQPKKIQKINSQNKKLSIYISSNECLDQQTVQAYINRQSLPSSKRHQQIQRVNLQDSQNSSRLSDDQESGKNSKKDSFQNNSNEKEYQYHKQDSLKYNSDNKIKDYFFQQNYESQLSPEFKISSQTQNNQQQSLNTNHSHLKGLFGTDQIILSPKEQQFQKRQPHFQQQGNSNQSNDSNINDSQIQKSQPFYRSPRKKSNTVKESNFISQKESYKKYLKSKYEPTQEQIEQSEQTPKRPDIQIPEKTKQKSKFFLKKQNSIQVQFSLQQDNFKFECEYITLKCTYYGSLQINEEFFQFISYEDKIRPKELYHTLNGSHIDSLLPKKLKKKILVLEIDSIHSRRFNMKEIAIEVFTDNQKSYYFNLYQPKSRKVFFKQMDQVKQTLLSKLQKQQENNQQDEANSYKKHGISLFKSKDITINDTHKSQIERLNQTIKKINRVEYFKQKKYTERWKKEEFSNFEYLMLVNQFSSRSFNDITQYPIFPWIFTRYDRQDIDLNNPEHYRDLSKPIGALNEKRLQDFIERYDQVIINQIQFNNHQQFNFIYFI